MSTEAAPTTAPAPAAPAPEAPSAPSTTPAEPAPEPKNAIERIVAKHAAKEAAKAKETPPEGAPPSPEAKPETPKPADKPEEQLSLKHAQLKSEHRQVLAENVKLKETATTATKERDELKAMFGPGKNHLQALEKLVGKPFKQIMEDAAKGAYDSRSGLSAEERAELDAMKQWREEQQRKAEESAKAAERADDVKLATDFLTDAADAYPVFGAAEWAAEELVNRAYAELKDGRQPDFAAIAKACEDAAVTNLEQLLGNQRIMAALAKRPNLAQSLAKTFGSAQQTAALPASGKSGASDGNGSRTLSHTTTQESPVPPPPADESEGDWLEGARARLAQLKKQSRII